MTTEKGGRPRDLALPTVTRQCPVHGMVEFRVHKIGFDHLGRQRYRARCPLCHADRNRKVQ